MNKFLKTLLRTGVYFLDQADEATAVVRDGAREQLGRSVARVQSLIRPRRSSTARNAVTFAAGVGLGIGAALLFVPASGGETRGAINAKVQAFGGSVRERFSRTPRPTGT